MGTMVGWWEQWWGGRNNGGVVGTMVGWSSKTTNIQRNVCVSVIITERDHYVSVTITNRKTQCLCYNRRLLE